ncbi:hypothetical protein CMV_026866 [Castanea mollissima]|uniref:BI1-like protein n=1 Tax=Castanea mollissima TaxID=60419 RepID=A0A8J4QB04_9ROSI|nr:hypothetical protein CMV_026866 [Castanea mollissima]
MRWSWACEMASGVRTVVIRGWSIEMELGLSRMRWRRRNKCNPNALVVLCPLYYYHKHHPWNFFILMLFTVSISFAVGLACAFTKGRIILEAAILTCVAVVSLTLYTFWAVKRGKDFSFLGPFLFASLLVLVVFGLIQIFIPLGKVSMMIYSGLASLIFCGYLVYDTDNIIKRYSYDDYIWASAALYLDVVNIFLSLLDLLDAANS